MWRSARTSDDDLITSMCLALNAEDPGPRPVPPEHVRRTLRALREEPWRGRALVLELDGCARGYALLISAWSNELGGEVCTVDELYVEPGSRGRGWSTQLLRSLADGTSPWAEGAAALGLEVTPGNAQARRLYERLGFTGRNQAMYRRLAR